MPGWDLISDWLELSTRIRRADIVLTGEGKFDESSLEGKGPGALARQALAAHKRVHVFAGQAAVPAEAVPAGLVLRSITPPGMPLAQALQSAENNLRVAVSRASLV